jgi:hypothetical protein
MASLCLFAYQACSGTPESATLSSAASVSSFDDCKPGAGVSGSPKTIEEAVTLINSLPKPVTVPCFIASLNRPLKATLTNSTSSAQPAAGNRSPRIFIVIDKLNISVVPDGVGQDVVEFSYMVSETMSVKAELEFPILNNVLPQEPYSRIRFNSATSCGICHGVESRYTAITAGEAFYSIAFQPQKSSKVSLDSLRNENAKCNSAVEPKRCAIISAFLNRGTVQNYDFPSIMPFFF